MMSNFRLIGQIILCVVMGYGGGNFLYGQQLLNAENNSCLIHLDKPIYVNGETIWYKIYMPQNLRQPSGVLKMHLCDKEGKIIRDHFLKLTDDGYAFGYIPIPYTLDTDIYHLVVNTYAQSGIKSFQLTDFPIPIYNDANIPTILDDDNPEVVNNSAEPSEGVPNLKLKLDKSTYQTNEKISVNIQLTNAQNQSIRGNASISVRDKGLIDADNLGIPNIYVFNLNLSPDTELDKNIYLQASFVDSLNRLIFSGTLVGYIPSTAQILTPETDGLGVFSLPLPDLYGNHQLQWVDAKNPSGVVKSKQFLRIFNHTALQYSANIIQYLHYSSERKKLYQLLGGIENEIQVTPLVFSSDSIGYNRKYVIADYDPFPDLPTFFQEILTPLKARRTRKGITYKMLNTDTRYKSFYPDQPIFIVNDYVVTDSKVINRLNYQDVEYIEMYNEYELLISRFGALGLNGIVKIHTKQDLSFLEDKLTNTFDIHTLQIPATFPKYEDQPDYFPNIRPQVYWNPQIEIGPNGLANFSFLHSDDLGDFEIEVVVQTEEGSIFRKCVDYKVLR